MFELYVTGYAAQPPIRLVDFNWVQYDEIRTQGFDAWNTYSDTGVDVSVGSLYLQPVNTNAAYLDANDLVTMRYSPDGGSTYSGWASTITFPPLKSGDFMRLDIKAENPNYSGSRGYSIFRLYSSAKKYDYEGAEMWGGVSWGAFIWSGHDPGKVINTFKAPMAVRAFMMDSELQNGYEEGGLVFP